MKFKWCYTETGRNYYQGGEYCSQKCRFHHQQSLNTQSVNNKPIIQKVVEKEYIYVDKTSNEEKEMLKQQADYFKTQSNYLKQQSNDTKIAFTIENLNTSKKVKYNKFYQIIGH